jgi:hypothetical protein
VQELVLLSAENQLEGSPKEKLQVKDYVRLYSYALDRTMTGDKGQLLDSEFLLLLSLHSHC